MQEGVAMRTRAAAAAESRQIAQPRPFGRQRQPQKNHKRVNISRIAYMAYITLQQTATTIKRMATSQNGMRYLAEVRGFEREERMKER
jgi:hypothetical protein